jgi:hypothetical protein
LQGNPQNVVPKLKQDLPDAVKVNWALWVPAQVGRCACHRAADVAINSLIDGS